MKWVVVAGVTGLLSAGLFSGLARLDQATFVLTHAALVTAFVVIYCRSNSIAVPQQIRRRWVGGVAGGLLFGLILIRGVLAQPASDAPGGGELAVALLWLGLVYGTADALLLNVIPVLAVYGSRGAVLRQGFRYRFRWGLAALGGSLLVTSLYHLGFVEYRGASLVQPLIGNAIITASYLLTGNPLAPVLAHVLMHGAAVLHGPATTHQLPPHY